MLSALLINSSFFARLHFLIPASKRKASLLELTRQARARATGRRPEVYFAPRP
ncbi:Hypothetical protein DEACI_1725 [Acididesulfobacillus acetoxydans]|uniref:Uncharacterized protein n=1 Tax=Acididesulfobacillus acetoxydans TaxID=1561005 RepID=A0A8S0WFI3_9FIRM|nr:Hypothetical protein DEACI_1725 [Acididesulfobacillus acetoxydans]CEJ06946.1 Hypothetical protein DEACI_1400 [Acididesulfobacillus acetoxydans]